MALDEHTLGPSKVRLFDLNYWTRVATPDDH